MTHKLRWIGARNGCSDFVREGPLTVRTVCIEAAMYVCLLHVVCMPYVKKGPVL